MSVDIHRRIPENLYLKLRDLEKKYKFWRILEEGIKSLTSKEEGSLSKKYEDLIANIKLKISYLNAIIDKHNNIIMQMSKRLSEINRVVENIRNISKYYNELVVKSFKNLIKRYNDLLQNYREDIYGLLTMLKNYLDSNQIKMLVRKFNRKFREFELKW